MADVAVSRAPMAKTAWHAAAFGDVVWAHFEAQRQRHAQGDSASAEIAENYWSLRATFESQEGRITREYWGTDVPIGLVLTELEPSRLSRLLGVGRRLKLHRSSELAAMPYEFEAALADGDTLAVKAAQVLSAGAAATVLSRVFEAHKFLLSVVNAEVHLDPDWSSTIREVLRRAREKAEQEIARDPVPGPIARAEVR